MNRKKMIHISHNDLDGVTPTIVTKILCDISGSYELFTMYIDPSNLLDTLKNIISDTNSNMPDIVLITDLSCSKEVIQYLWESELMRITCIMDHHWLNYDPIEFSNSDEIKAIKEKYGKEYAEIDPLDHINIINENPILDMAYAGLSDGNKTKRTCGTKIYCDLLLDERFDGIFDYATSANSLAIKNVVSGGITNIDAEKLQYLSNVVRMYDTFDFYDEPDNYISIDAIRLNTFFHTVGKEVYCDYITNYLLDPNIQWGQLTFDNDIFPIGTIVDINIKKCEAHIEYKSNQVVKMLWRPKVLNKITKEVDFLTVPILVGIVITDDNLGMIATRILETHTEIEMVVIPTYTAIHLYSRKDSEINVGKISTMFGGGGHNSAAGFPISEENAQWMIRNYLTGLTNLASGIAKTTVVKNEDGTESIEERYGE